MWREFLLIVSSLFLFLIGCNDPVTLGYQDFEDVILDEILFGSAVTANYQDGLLTLNIDNSEESIIETFEIDIVPFIDGILVNKSHHALTTGCFEVPECVRMDDTKGRAVVSISLDDFTLYWEDNSEEFPGDITGVTYFSTDWYFPYGASNANRNQLRNEIQNEVGLWNGHPSMHGKRLGWCQEKNPHTCYQDEVDGGM